MTVLHRVSRTRSAGTVGAARAVPRASVSEKSTSSSRPAVPGGMRRKPIPLAGGTARGSACDPSSPGPIAADAPADWRGAGPEADGDSDMGEVAGDRRSVGAHQAPLAPACDEPLEFERAQHQRAPVGRQSVASPQGRIAERLLVERGKAGPAVGLIVQMPGHLVASLDTHVGLSRFVVDQDLTVPATHFAPTSQTRAGGVVGRPPGGIVRQGDRPATPPARARGPRGPGSSQAMLARGTAVACDVGFSRAAPRRAFPRCRMLSTYMHVQ